MEDLRVSVIGTGDPSARDETGYAMAYDHARGYAATPGCRIVACADIIAANARAFAQEFGISADGIFTDAKEMLETVNPDVLSICTPIRTHAELVIGAARTGDSLAAIHCEKPMAWTWGEARAMASVAAEEGVQLTFNHQRRFATPVQQAHRLIESDAIGELQRIEMGPPNLFDYGTHSIDLANAFTGDVDTRWVLANVDCRAPARWFDIHTENHALAMWETTTGVYCLASSGDGAEAVGCHHRLIGTDGVIELGVDGTPLRLRGREDRAWQTVDTGGDTMHGPGYVERAIGDIVDSVRTGRRSTLDATNALRTTEIIFAAYESARRQGRADLPLTIEDNPLDTLLPAEAR